MIVLFLYVYVTVPCVNSCVDYLSIFIEDLITSMLKDDILFYLLLSIYSQRIYLVLEAKKTTLDG